MKSRVALVVAAAFILVGCLGMTGVLACTGERAQLIKTALDHADRGCKAYLELRNEPLEEASPAADAGTNEGKDGGR